VAQLLEKHFALLEVERTTKSTYENLARTHIVPLIGKVKLRRSRRRSSTRSMRGCAAAGRTAIDAW
jgi:hypothetical protein